MTGVLVGTLVAAAGLVAHNVSSLPLAPLAPETIAPVAVYAALLAWLVARPGAGARVATLAWAAANLVGGGVLSVLPLPFLPFMPEQTPAHYAAHVIYAVTQVPLIASIWKPRASALA